MSIRFRNVQKKEIKYLVCITNEIISINSKLYAARFYFCKFTWILFCIQCSSKCFLKYSPTGIRGEYYGILKPMQCVKIVQVFMHFNKPCTNSLRDRRYPVSTCMPLSNISSFLSGSP